MASKSAPRAPRLTPIELDNLMDNEDAFFGPGDTYDGQRFDRPSFDGADLTSTDFLECELRGATFHDA